MTSVEFYNEILTQKHMKRIFTFITVLIALSSCKCGIQKALLPSISGKAGEVIVVIDQGSWEGSVGTALRDTLASDFPYLPQREPLYTLINVPYSAFTNIFEIHRNIILVNISNKVTEPGVVYKTDVWAKPQCVIAINAIDSESATQLIEDHKERIATTLEQAERDRVIANSIKYEELSLAPIVQNMIGGSPHFPMGYSLKKAVKDFIWISYNTQILQGILIYKYPVGEDQNPLSLESLITKRNQVLKDNVPGMFENTYMTTSSFGTPGLKYLRFRGRDFAEIRGLWEVENDYMGGPFVSHSFYSPDGQEIIVLEAFVYAPKYDKRQFLRQVESILYSFEWKKIEENI